MIWDPQFEAPRCGHPVAYRAKNDPGTGLPAVCWRPYGHAQPDRHRSRPTYERELDRARHRRRRNRARQREVPVLSAPPASVIS